MEADLRVGQVEGQHRAVDHVGVGGEIGGEDGGHRRRHISAGSHLRPEFGRELVAQRIGDGQESASHKGGLRFYQRQRFAGSRDDLGDGLERGRGAQASASAADTGADGTLDWSGAANKGWTVRLAMTRRDDRRRKCLLKCMEASLKILR